MTYPTAFYIIHKLFSGPAFPTPVWGDLGDGPLTDFEHVVTLVYDAFYDEAWATRGTLRVWHIEPGKPALDVTDIAIKDVAERWEALNA
jgi:hypothetical protein